MRNWEHNSKSQARNTHYTTVPEPQFRPCFLWYDVGHMLPRFYAIMSLFFVYLRYITWWYWPVPWTRRTWGWVRRGWNHGWLRSWPQCSGPAGARGRSRPSWWSPRSASPRPCAARRWPAGSASRARSQLRGSAVSFAAACSLPEELHLLGEWSGEWWVWVFSKL